MRELDKYDPMKEIFNVVSLSYHPTLHINSFGYHCQSLHTQIQAYKHKGNSLTNKSIFNKSTHRS